MSERRITGKGFTDDGHLAQALQAVDAVHDVLEDFTPPEALDVLKMVQANLKAEIRSFNEVSK